jgi:hypothetical protein
MRDFADFLLLLLTFACFRVLLRFLSFDFGFRSILLYFASIVHAFASFC